MQKIKLFLLFCAVNLSQLTATTYLETYASANHYEDIKNYPLAIEYYQKTIELEPRFAGGYNGLGFIYLEQAQYPEARTELNKALELQPKYILPLMNIGASYYREGDTDRAEKYFKKVLGLDPHNARAYTNLAIICYHKKNYPGAYSYYQKAKKADVEYLKQRYNKEKSLKELEKLRHENPDDLRLKALEEKIKNEEFFLP